MRDRPDKSISTNYQWNYLAIEERMCSAFHKTTLLHTVLIGCKDVFFKASINSTDSETKAIKKF